MVDETAPVHGRETDSAESGQETAPADREIGRGDLIYGEGQLVLADGVIVQTHFVQLEEAPLFEWPQDSPVLIRGGRTKHAIENGARLRLSKPEAFRRDDGTLISDRSEGVTQRGERHVDEVAIDAPGDMKLAQQRDAEHNALAAAIGSRSRATTTGTRTETTTANRETRTHGKNGWILCASVRPAEEAGMKAWRESLNPEYDHVTTINSPRDFARALAKMVASQLGPLGAEVTYTHPMSKQRTMHPIQTVLHGPVAYVDDPYTYVEDATNPFEVMLRAVFFKHTRFRDQREYRFVVLTEAEPEERTIDIKVSPDMLDTLAIPDEQSTGSPLSDDDDASLATSVLAEKEHQGERPPTRRNDPARLCPQKEPATDPDRHDEADPLHPHGQDGGIAVPTPIVVAVQTAQGLGRLRHLVLEADNDPQVASAAFYAVWPLEALLATFVDPISNLEWRDGGFIITLNMPPGSDKEGQLALGTHGTGQYRIGTSDDFTEVRCDQGWMLVQELVNDLEQQGLIPWSQMPEKGLLIRPSEPESGSEPQVWSNYSAEIARTTTTSLDTVDEAEIDRINAQEPRSPDDARISKVVIDGGPGHVVKLRGIRDGLSGVITQRAEVDSVTIAVETINPHATTEIDPPDADSEASGHQVALPECKDTSIRITASSPDGTTTSHLDIVLKRSPKSDGE